MYLDYTIDFVKTENKFLFFKNEFTNAFKKSIIELLSKKLKGINYMKKEINTLELMTLAINQAKKTMNENIGGPFGALVIDKEGNILSIASNSVLGDHDPTAHAEINAIRKATQKLGSHDLTDCTLYTTAYPCPMCLGAIIWSNIKNVVYGCSASDADAIGFRDDFIYKFIEGGMKDKKVIDMKELHREECLSIFKEYQEKEKTLY